MTRTRSRASQTYNLETRAASISGTALQDLVQRTEALKDRVFEKEMTIKVVIKGALVPCEGGCEVEDLEIEATLPDGVDSANSAIKNSIEESIFELISDQPGGRVVAGLSFVEEPVAELENEIEGIVQEVTDLEDSHDINSGDLLIQLEEKTSVALS